MTSPTLPEGPNAGSAPSDSDSGTLAPGTLVADRYRIDRTLGEGGMGVVYLAEHVAMRKTVALKVLHAEGSRNSEIVQRFEREAVAAASIDHHHVAAATDFGALPDGSFYLVLEFVSGHSLRELVAAGAIEPARALGILRGVVAGVAAAHARGIVHRDLKPENVMLTDREGNPDYVKVLDFGIAKVALEAEPTGPASRPLTRIGTIMGTPNYMSPEQAVGQPCDARADVYALGVVFYEMLVGEPLFDGEPVMVLAAHVTSPPPPLPEAVRAALGPRGDEVLQKMLAKSPDDRFQTAVELQAALQELGAQLSPQPASVALAAAAPPPQLVAHAVTAPTQLAVAEGPAEVSPRAGPVRGDVASHLASRRAAEGTALEGVPAERSRRMAMGAILAAAAVGLLLLLVLALRGPARTGTGSAPAPSASASGEANELPALPGTSGGTTHQDGTGPGTEEPKATPAHDAGTKAGGGKGGGGKKGGKKGAFDDLMTLPGKIGL